MNDGSRARLAAELRSWIANAPPGARLPSTRALVAQHQVSPVTVQKALRDLASKGLIDSRPGVGTFVRAVRTARLSDYGWQTAALRSPQSWIQGVSTAMRNVPNDVIALHAGYPDRELLPERLVRSALTRAARGYTALSRSPVAGLPELQSWFAHELGGVGPGGNTPPTPHPRL